MIKDNDKIHRLIEVAKRYYLDNMTQNEIAKEFSISRPLVSKLLNDAIEMGIVTININYPRSYSTDLAQELKKLFNLDDVYIISQTPTVNTDNYIAEKAIEYITKELVDVKYLGIGWGNIISNLTDNLEKKEKVIGNLKGKVVPLIGNTNIPFKGYHPNELVRIIGEKTGLTPSYLFSPAFLTSYQEKEIFLSVENYKEISNVWDKLDLAIVGINSHPSVPDLATALRFGDALSKKRAVGKVLSYYFDKKGKIIQGENNFSVEIPLEALKKTKKVIGIASSKVNKNAIIGALNSRIITHLIITSEVAKEILNEK